MEPAGKSGISKIENFDASELSTHFAGEVKHLDCTGYVSAKMERRLDPYIKYTLVAAKKGLEYAGLDKAAMEKLDKNRYIPSLLTNPLRALSIFRVHILE